jgi:excisionase family DNA binding protein
VSPEERERREAGREVVERHYSTRELAELLGAHPETIRREAMRGRLRSVRVGSERRYPVSAVEEYLGRQERGRS